MFFTNFKDYEIFVDCKYNIDRITNDLFLICYNYTTKSTKFNSDIQEFFTENSQESLLFNSILFNLYKILCLLKNYSTNIRKNIKDISY